MCQPPKPDVCFFVAFCAKCVVYVSTVLWSLLRFLSFPFLPFPFLSFPFLSFPFLRRAVLSYILVSFSPTYTSQPADPASESTAISKNPPRRGGTSTTSATAGGNCTKQQVEERAPTSGAQRASAAAAPPPPPPPPPRSTSWETRRKSLEGCSTGPAPVSFRERSASKASLRSQRPVFLRCENSLVEPPVVLAYSKRGCCFWLSRYVYLPRVVKRECYVRYVQR